MPLMPEPVMADGPDAVVLSLGRSLPLHAASELTPRPASPPLSGGESNTPEAPPLKPPAASRQETLAERLDHALDDIRRLTISSRTKGPH